MQITDLLAPDAAIKLHPGRMDHWEVNFADLSFKRAVFENPRLFSRLIEDLSGGHFQIDHDAPEIVDLAARLGGCGSLRDIGLGWCAPRLFLCLFNKETRTACGGLTSDQVALVTALRHHAGTETIPVLPDEEMIEKEGRQCLLAWLVEQDTPEAFAFVQRFAPSEEIDLRQSIQRARFFDLYIEYCETLGK